MKQTIISEGQIYETKMLSKFAPTRKQTLSPITILANVAGYVIFKRDGSSNAIPVDDFISTYLDACNYKLAIHDFNYHGYLVVWDNGDYVIGSPISTTTKTADGAKDVIDFWNKRHI